MSHAWFLYSNEVVTGPFKTEDVQTRINTGALPPKSFIWWKGQREWIPIATWQEQLDSILAAATTQAQKPVWYIDAGTSPIGPLTQDEMISNLNSINDLGRVRLWAVGMQKWVSLFELHDVMELLGISRREHERAPLMGSVAVTRSNEDPRGFVVRAASISVAGMGLSGSHDLRRGDEVALLIKSPDLPGNIHVRGEIAYTTEQGYAGVRFAKTSAETQAIILDYVKRFKVAIADENAA